jgi:hypothetical protein
MRQRVTAPESATAEDLHRLSTFDSLSLILYSAPAALELRGMTFEAPRGGHATDRVLLVRSRIPILLITPGAGRYSGPVGCAFFTVPWQ